MGRDSDQDRPARGEGRDSDQDRPARGEGTRQGPPGRRGPARRLAAETYARWLAWAAGLALVAGVVVLLLAHGVAASVVGIVLLGLAGIALVAVAFLLVGASEERDRMRHPRG
jgi:hypothetical protein